MNKQPTIRETPYNLAFSFIAIVQYANHLGLKSKAAAGVLQIEAPRRKIDNLIKYKWCDHGNAVHLNPGGRQNTDFLARWTRVDGHGRVTQGRDAAGRTRPPRRRHQCFLDALVVFYTGLAFNSIVNDSRLLKAHVQTSKICLLLLLNLLQICFCDNLRQS